MIQTLFLHYLLINIELMDDFFKKKHITTIFQTHEIKFKPQNLFKIKLQSNKMEEYVFYRIISKCFKFTDYNFFAFLVKNKEIISYIQGSAIK